MAYKVGQIRKQSDISYMSNVQGVVKTVIQTHNPFTATGSDSHFNDVALTIDGGTFQKDVVYFLRFSISRVPSGFYSQVQSTQQSIFSDADSLKYTVLLTNLEGSSSGTAELDQDTIIQEVGSFTVPPHENMEVAYYTNTITFIPNSNYTYLVFRLGRISYDALLGVEGNTPTERARDWLEDNKSSSPWEASHIIYRQEGSQGVTINDDTLMGARFLYGQQVPDYEGQIDYTSYGDFCIVNNILPTNRVLNKIGFQSRPGSLILVNNQPIRVGRSGIYEINNGTLIRSFMITAPNGVNSENVDAFLLDYTYNE